MNIKWLGHACFLLTSEAGEKVITDPYDTSVGYRMPPVAADVVTVSHNHFDHNYIKAVSGSYKLVDSPGEYEVKGLKIKGVPSWHDDAGGAKRGPNVIFNITIDGIRVCHCGDLGHVLSGEQADKIGEVDVLMVPVGGTYTVDAKGAAGVVRQLNPSVVIPMHYKTPVIDFPIDGVEKFISEMGGGEKLPSGEIDISRENIHSLKGIKVLNYQ